MQLRIIYYAHVILTTLKTRKWILKHQENTF
jgi:hypothetical protein